MNFLAQFNVLHNVSLEGATMNTELIVMLQQELRGLRQDMQAGFQQVTDAVTQTNLRLDQTNDRLDRTNDRLDQTNDRLDQTIGRIDQTNNRLDQFMTSVSDKLDGIGHYLRLIDGSFIDHSERISKLESRVDRLEDAS